MWESVFRVKKKKCTCPYRRSVLCTGRDKKIIIREDRNNNRKKKNPKNTEHILD